MKSVIFKSLGLALWLIVLQVPFTFIVQRRLFFAFPEFRGRFEWVFLTGGSTKLSINLLDYSLQFVFIFVVTAVYLSLCGLIARRPK
jgi:hypothetical protein